MKSSTKKPKASQATPDPKVPVFLRLPKGVHGWLADEVATGRYNNVQDKILDVLRDAQDAQSRQQEQAA